MNKHYTRLPVGHTAAKERKEQLKSAQKNDVLHEKHTKKPKLKNDSIQDGIRAAKVIGWRNSRRGLVYIHNTSYNPTTTPSHNIPLLLESFPPTVTTAYDEETLTPIKQPFQLPLYSELGKGKNTGDMLKPYFYQLALSEMEENSQNQYRLTPFVFTTSVALETRFQGQQRERVDFMRDQLQKALKQALQRPYNNQVAFWFALEMARRGQPHIQGSLLIREDEQEAVRLAFYELNGGGDMTLDERRDCLRFGLNKREYLFTKRGYLYTDLNWADYNLKERATTRRDYNDLRPVIAASQPLKSHTADYYRRLRKAFNSRLRVLNKAKSTDK